MTVIYLDRKTIGICFAGTAVIFSIGVIIGHYSTSGSDGPISLARTSRQITTKENFSNKDFVKSTLDMVNSTNIRGFLEVLSKEPHIAGSERDRYLTQWIKDQWTGFGLDSVNLDTYDILLSYPKPEDPNKIYLYDADGNVKFTSRHKEDVLRPEDEHPDFVHAFNAYAPAGDIMGELVYVNYGRIEDILQLKELGVSLEGKIAISRYGKIFRGNRLKNCQDAGAIGVIMFSDPGDVAVQGVAPENVYPNTFFLPESGIQRGSTFIGTGDPLSPGWASVEGAYRQAYNETEGLPKIPSQPIGYGDAKELLSVMGGQEVPEEWQGGIAGIKYRMGPGFGAEYQGWKVRLVVNNVVKEVKDSNVLGLIRGQEEPDRYVVICNHRDAWGYGAVDPSSGTCAMMEAARVMGNLVKSGKWRPRRSIIFASWASEEYGLMGSNEWVYDKIHKLMNKAVAVINVDICVKGDILDPEASPLLKDVFLDAIRNVPSSRDPSKTYYEFLDGYINDDGQKTPRADLEPRKKVEDEVTIMGSGSDHAPFIFYAGVPALKFDFEVDRKKYPGFSSYPMYHTGFETFYLVDQILDKGFKLHRTCSQMYAHMALNLADSAVLPFTTSHLVSELRKGVEVLDQGKISQTLASGGAGPAYQLMLDNLEMFSNATVKWTEEREKMIAQGTLNDPLKLRQMNDQIMLLERVFLLPEGLPGRPHIRHALFSPAKFNTYGGSAFPGIGDLMHQVESLEEAEKEERFNQVRKHLSDLMIILRQATSWLSTDFVI